MDWDEVEPAVGWVIDDDRGDLPFALIHGEPLVAAAAWALGEAEVRILDLGTPWESVLEFHAPVVLHDCLCPMTPPEHIAACVELARDQGAVVVSVRPVTDTVKGLEGGLVGGTIDRERLVSVTSPVVLPVGVAARLPQAPGSDLVALVAALEADPDIRVDRIEAPSSARRVGDRDDVAILEALTRG